MISLCVFSKNRPMQLDAFLKSLFHNAKYINDVYVLYTYDEEKFEEGYDIVSKTHANVKFIQEGERYWWKNQILELVSGFQPYFLWATDDSIFYRYTNITQETLRCVFEEYGAKSLNLRVGLNIKWQNHWHTQLTPEIPVSDTIVLGTERYSDIIIWDATNMSVQNDIGRVWQNDASIMPRDEYLERLEIETEWWKGKGCRALDNVAQSGNIFNPRIAASFKQSSYLNIPVNLVHLLDDGRLYADNWGKFIQQDIHSLYERFMNGERIDWQSINTEGVDCGRKEVKYTYE